MLDTDIIGLDKQVDNCRTEDIGMPRSCKCILDTMVFKGAMTKEERDKIVRNLKTQNEGGKTMGKLIDVDAFKARINAGLVYQGADVLEALDEQPTIEELQEQKVCKWVEERTYMECPNCHDIWHYEFNQTKRFKFCPHCGADKEGAEE